MSTQPQPATRLAAFYGHLSPSRGYDHLVDRTVSSDYRRERDRLTAPSLDALRAWTELLGERDLEGLRDTTDNVVTREHLEVLLSERRWERLKAEALREAEHEAWRRSIGAGRVGYRSGDVDEGWTQWAAFPASDSRTDDELIEDLGWEASYTHPGGPYAHRPHARRRGSRILVTQRGGWDI